MSTTYVVEEGVARQAWPPLPVGCACRTVSMDPDGCVPEYHMPGVGAVVPLAAYRAAVERGWRWRIAILRNRWNLRLIGQATPVTERTET